MVRGDWPNYEELVKQFHNTDPKMVEAWPNQEYGTDEHGQPNALSVIVKPLGLQQLKEEPQEVRRQVTIDGTRVDLRNRSNFDLVNTGIEQVEVVAQSYLTQLRNKPIKKVRRACKCQLQRIMLLRGPELHCGLYASICLRIGAPLPPYFWYIPPEGD
jgi:hypothetical protein